MEGGRGAWTTDEFDSRLRKLGLPRLPAAGAKLLRLGKDDHVHVMRPGANQSAPLPARRPASTIRARQRQYVLGELGNDGCLALVGNGGHRPGIPRPGRIKHGRGGQVTNQ